MKKITLLVACFVCIDVQAQEEVGEIITDRPDQTESAFVVSKGAIQIETGSMYESTNLENNATVSTFTYNTTLLRIGLTDFVELRVIQEYVNEANNIDNNKVAFSGLGPLTLGAKIHVADEKGFFPQIGFLGHLTFKTGKVDLMPTYVAPDFRFSFEHSLTEKIGMGYNIGAEWNGISADVTYIYTYVLGFDISSHIGLFAEAYGFIPTNDKSDHRLDGGFTYVVKHKIQFDVSGGVGLSDVSPDYFISGGLSILFSKSKSK